MSVDKSPVYEVKAVPVEKVYANDYNPNVVAPPEMKLLELSIWEDGFTMPCVCYYNKEEDRYILVDGYHRYTVLKTSQRIYKRENGLLPIVVIDKDLSNRMSSTIRHNRARGMHNIELMCNIVNGILILAAIRFTNSVKVLRPSWLAVISRKTSSSAPCSL